MTEPRKLRVFLCHSSQDKPIVRELYQRLNAEGWIEPWLDEEKLLPGMDWGVEIPAAVKNSDIVVVCISKTSTTKEGYVQKEIAQALDIAEEKPEGTMFIIPLQLEDCAIPGRLRRWQWLTFYPKNIRDEKINKLLQALKIKATQLDLNINYYLKDKGTDPFIQKLILSTQLVEEYLSNSIDGLFSAFKTRQEGSTQLVVNGQRVIGSLFEFGWLLLFLYADVSQGINSLSLIFPEYVIPEFFNNLAIPILISSVGSVAVLGMILYDLLGLTKFSAWSNIRHSGQRNVIFSIVIITMVMSVVFSTSIALLRLSVLGEIPESLLKWVDISQSFIIVPMLITTILLFNGVLGFLVIFGIFLSLLRVPISTFRIFLTGLEARNRK